MQAATNMEPNGLSKSAQRRLDTQVEATISESARPLVSLVLPAYNEADILARNLETLREYMDTLAERFAWEMVIVNDGSIDGTAEIAEGFAREHDNVLVLHHARNRGLGQAFKTGFSRCAGDYIVTLDVDLSYAPDHIEQLLNKIIESHAKLVLASPYMKGGRLSSVPWARRILSIVANRFLSFFSHGQLSTLTCMVRAYDGQFVRSLTHRATGMEIMPETVYKTMIMRGSIEQIPAHLDWGLQNAAVGRRSSMKVLRHILGTLLSGFIFRPFMFFILPGLVLLAFAAYVNTWMMIHFFDAYLMLDDVASGRASAAVALAYDQYPHTFIVGLLSLMLAIQLVSLGILALQSKNYFEEVFYLGTTMKRAVVEKGQADSVKEYR